MDPWITPGSRGAQPRPAQTFLALEACWRAAPPRSQPQRHDRAVTLLLRTFLETQRKPCCCLFGVLSVNMSASDSTAHWDEAQCMAALAQLEQLQAQVCTCTQPHGTILICSDRRPSPRNTQNHRTVPPATESIDLQAVFAGCHWLSERHKGA